MPIPISLPHFLATLRTLLLPTPPHRISLAISGGPDSMALAALFSHAHTADPSLALAAPRIPGIDAFIIDHGFRPESSAEAVLVAEVLRKSFPNVSPIVAAINWTDYGFTDGREAASAGNLEGLARRARYRVLGRLARERGSRALFVAHHAGDVYETVVMRMISGVRGPRGLSGIRETGDIPECEGIYGVHRSGEVDLRGAEDVKSSVVHSECGGVRVYRPLLSFSKEDLLVTCRAAGIPYITDKTNQDPTLTPRNAIRYLAANYTLPRSLQKGRILKLAANCQEIREQQDSEARRFLGMLMVTADLAVGKLEVDVSKVDLTEDFRRSKTALCLAVGRLLQAVSPNQHAPELKNIPPVIPRIFPKLHPGNSIHPPFSFHGLLVTTTTRQIITLTRQPFAKDPATISFPPYPLDQKQDQGTTESPPWPLPQLWDNRFWITLRSTIPHPLVISPLTPASLSVFRKQLPRQTATELKETLRRGRDKVRFTLPGVYVCGSAKVGKRGLIVEEESKSGKMTLLSIPTLGIGLPGVDQCLETRVSFKMIEPELRSKIDS